GAGVIEALPVHRFGATLETATQRAVKPLSVVVVGNSITWHRPLPSIQWAGDWGMAATAANRDYYSTLGRLVSSKSGVRPAMTRLSMASLEKDPSLLAKVEPDVIQQAKASDLLVVQLGDNAPKDKLDQFAVSYNGLIDALRPTHGGLVCMSTWWHNPETDDIIARACVSRQGKFVVIGDIADQPWGRAGLSNSIVNPGVAAHPSDQAMREIALRIYQAWLGR
ncbi:MAG: SGNH/GDSL hydrolase family protein, partial [Burkholderiales bacterium]